MKRLLDSGAYSKWIRGSVVQAQYFRDADDLERYLQFSEFLADINNEIGRKNQTYIERLGALEKLVLFRFSNDTTVVPRDSAHFSMQDGEELVPLRSSRLYTQDWLGLKRLEQRGGLIMNECPGVHMQFTLDWFEENVVRRYLAGDGASTAKAAVA
jgi:palmitoyl-protein thioesterase